MTIEAASILANPWVALPKSPPYVLADDAAPIREFNRRASPDCRFELGLLPEPYFGSISAPVVLLALNPGVSAADIAFHAQPDFAKQCRMSMAHQLVPYPFLHLQPGGTSPGSAWWTRICRALIAEVGFDAVAKGLLCLQYFPYHSATFGSRSVDVKSQRYTFDLLRSAIDRESEIVVMRSRKRWEESVPELRLYQSVHAVRNPRNPALSKANLGASFGIVCDRLRDVATR